MTDYYFEMPENFNPGTDYEEVSASISRAQKEGRRSDMIALLRQYGGIMQVSMCLNYQRWQKQLELEVMEDFLNYGKFSQARS